MKETDEDLCAALVTRKNYAIVASEFSVETCSNEDARCQLRVVGESLFSSQLALGLQKSKKKLDRGSIRSSPRDGLSTQHRETVAHPTYYIAESKFHFPLMI